MAASTQAAHLNRDFAWALYGYWGLVLLVGVLHRLIQYLRHASLSKLSPIEHQSSDHQSKGVLSHLSIWTRRNLILPRPSPSSWSTLPTRVETLLITLYLALCLILCFPGYYILHPSKQPSNIELAQQISNRLGTLAVAQIPIIWIFAARNDPFLWLTKWSFATYSQFHRWVGRGMVVLAVAHGVGYSVIDGMEGRYVGVWEKEFWYCGVIAVISLAVLGGTSVGWMRKRWYDVFLVVHFVFAMVVLVCVFFHLKTQDGKFNGFLWPAVAIWSLDRLLRLLRIAYFSLKPNVKGVKATATWLEGTDLIRVDVTDFFRGKETTPGAHFFLYEPGRLQGYESHPFTLCSWHYPALDPKTSVSEKDPESEMSSPISTGSIWKDVDFPRVHTKGTISTCAEKPQSSELRCTFLIRPRNGFTRRLHRRTSVSSLSIEAGGVASKDFRILLEGPYGTSVALCRHSAVLMIIGGSGITSAVSRIDELLHEPHNETKVRLVWAVQKLQMAEDVARHELSGVLGHPRLRVDVYVTRSNDADVQSSDDLRLFAANKGRPNVEALIREEREKCSGSLAVFSCGPTDLQTSCRNSVIRILGEKGRHIHYHEERFEW